MITEPLIHETADRLQAEGKKPTLAAIRAALGGGSFTTISEAMKTWRAAQRVDHALAEVEIPAEVRERLESATAAIWQSATSEAEQRLTAERHSMAEAQAAAQAEIGEAGELIETLEKEAEELRQQLAAQAERLAETQTAQAEGRAQLSAIRERLAETQAERDDAKAEAKAAVIEAAELRGQLAALGG